MKFTKIATILTMFSMLFLYRANAQQIVRYNDVGVIINKNSAVSLSVGKYFAQKRRVPPQNIIVITADTSEAIDSSTFELIRHQIQDTIVKRGLTTKLNYLVTTRGVPLAVHRSDSCVLTSESYITNYNVNKVRCSSFDADLMLILGKDSVHIGKGDIIDSSNNVLNQPYFGATTHFSKAKYDIYLVSRLDAYSTSEIYRMIDSSGPNTLVNKDSALFVMDAEKSIFSVPLDTFSGTYYTLNQGIKKAAKLLSSRGWKVLADSTSKYITNQRNVLGYVSWGSDADSGRVKKGNVKPVDKWYKASYAEMFSSFTARSFAYPPLYPSQQGGALISDLINQGCTGASGPVYEPLSFAFSDVRILFERYTDTTKALRYNLAESFYMANPTMSWMMTLIGDPKTSIITYKPPVPQPKMDTITKVCQNAVRVLNTSNNGVSSISAWYKGDTNAIRATKQPLDSLNPLWAGNGTSLTVPTADTGTFTLTYANENISGLAIIEVKYKVIPCKTALEDVANHIVDLNIYPNPSSGSFDVNASFSNNSEATLTIKDVLGRDVFSKSYGNTFVIEDKISISNPGVYFLTLTAGTQLMTRKIVVK